MTSGIPEAYLHNAGFATTWNSHVAPVIDALSQRDCHIKQIRIRLDKVTVEIVPGTGHVDDLLPFQSVVYGRTTYACANLENATVIWEKNHANQ